MSADRICGGGRHIMIQGTSRTVRKAAAEVAPGEWDSAGKLPKSVWLATNTAVALNNGKVLLAGGEDEGRNARAEATLYVPEDNIWKATGKLTTSRRLHTLTRLQDGRVLATGGISGPFAVPPTQLASAEIYDPSSEKWTLTGSMQQARFFHSATLLADGKVLVAGGAAVRSPSPVSYQTLNSAELFDPSTGTWTPTGAMTDARFWHPAVSLQDGRVLVAGGMVAVTQDDAAGIAHCEIYDPTSRTWKPTGNLVTPRTNAKAVPLPDGSVLLTGGGQGIFQSFDYSPYSLFSTERFDPNTGRWSPAEDMPWGLSFHQAVPLRSGKVLVMGGTDTGCVDVGYREAFIYDPAARTWSITGGLNVGRWDFAAVGLADGRVVAAGGITLGALATPTGTEQELTKTAEIFTPDLA